MAYTPQDLKQKLLDMYPEISGNNISISLIFDNQKDAWIITFEKQGHQRHAFLDQKDADDCMEGNKCIYLGVLVSQYIKDLENEIGRG